MASEEKITANPNYTSILAGNSPLPEELSVLIPVPEQELPAALTYQKPTDEMIEKIQRIRESLAVAWRYIEDNVPQCAERTLALRKIEEVSFWANKALVFDGKRYL